MKYAAEMWNKIESEQSSLCAVESVNPDLPYFLGSCPFTLRSASCSTFKFINCQPQKGTPTQAASKPKSYQTLDTKGVANKKPSKYSGKM